MQRTFCVLSVLACFHFHLPMGCLAADAPPGEPHPPLDAPASFPWSDASAYARIPKTLLHNLDIWSITISNHETMGYVLTQDFIDLCAVTPDEKTRLTAAVTNALHAYRTAKAKHWTPSKAKASLPGDWELAAIERFDFTQEPIPEERAAVYDALRRQVRAILGPERSTLFWEYGERFLDAEQTGFGGADRSSPGARASTIYAFLLRKVEPGLEVDWFMSASFGGGGSSAGGRYVQVFDQYAPESMKPILARWRMRVADSKTNQTHTAKSLSGPSAVTAEARKASLTNHEAANQPPATAQAATTAKWEDAASYVDVPKMAIKSLRVAGLTEEQALSDEAAWSVK